MGHSIHNIDISKQLYTLSAICPVQWKPGFIREENTSPKCKTPSNVSIFPIKSVTTTNFSQVETPMRMTSMQMSFPETVSDSLRRNYLVMQQTDCCSSCPGGWSQTILEVKMLDVEVLGWCGYTWSAVVSTGCTHIHVGCTAKFPKTPLETAYGGEMNIQFTDNSSGGHSAVSMPIARSLKIAVALWPLFSPFSPDINKALLSIYTGISDQNCYYIHILCFAHDCILQLDIYFIITLFCPDQRWKVTNYIYSRYCNWVAFLCTCTF